MTTQREWLVAGLLTGAFSLLVMALRPTDRLRARNMLVVALLLGLAQAINLLVAYASAALHAGYTNVAVHGWIADIIYLATTAIVIRLAGILLFRALLPWLRITPAQIVEDLLVAAVVLLWIGMWLRTAGLNLSSVVTTSAVLTGIIAFSMQDTLGNILGGLFLQLDRSLRIGDWVRIDDVSGRVTDIRWRYTAIETRGRETVIVPNSSLMRSRFTVMGSRHDPSMHWRRSISFSLTADNDFNGIEAVLVQAVVNADIAHIATDLAPTCVLMELLPAGGVYALRYWLTDPRYDDMTDSAVRLHCQAALRRAGVRVAMPSAEHYVIKENETYRSAREAAELQRRLAVLRQTDIFRILAESELTELAKHLTHAPFVEGDVITRQGAVAHWLYLIAKGQADVWIAGSKGARALVATLSDGQVFGEMGMMTGEPRRATVIAKTAVDCYRLDKAGFSLILSARPDLAAEMSRVLVEREAELVRQKVIVNQPEPEKRQADILASIREFFALDDQSSR
jgi:small-conductance mechanosensitive channel/CRP-like cAMP-binding protein